MRALAGAFLTTLFLGCGAEQTVVKGRTFNLDVPSNASNEALPLVIQLHGLGGNATEIHMRMGLARRVGGPRILLATPNGTKLPDGRRFWNATDACCDFGESGVDDVGFIKAIIDSVSAEHSVDAKRVFVMGHSNGGFMALRMACELPDRVAGVISLAGGGFKDAATHCPSGRPVQVLQVHGTADETVEYQGGTSDNGQLFPGAVETTDNMARRNGCQLTREPVGDALNLDWRVPGNETTRERYVGCPADGQVELWTMKGSPHIPIFHGEWADSIVEWMMAHGR